MGPRYREIAFDEENMSEAEGEAMDTEPVPEPDLDQAPAAPADQSAPQPPAPRQGPAELDEDIPW